MTSQSVPDQVFSDQREAIEDSRFGTALSVDSTASRAG